MKKRQNPTDYFVPLDEYIDVDRLVSLDESLKNKLDDILRNGFRSTGLFGAGERLDPAAPERNGTRAIGLRRQISGGYDRIHDAACWEDSETAAEFPDLMDFVKTLPLVSYGRYFIIFDYDGVVEPPHRDHGDPRLRQEFIWFRPNKTKNFYIYEKRTKQKIFVDSYSAWFDTRHYHGTDPSDGLSISIRVDGVFTDELRARIDFDTRLVPPAGLSIPEKLKRRWHFFRRNHLKSGRRSRATT